MFFRFIQPNFLVFGGWVCSLSAASWDEAGEQARNPDNRRNPKCTLSAILKLTETNDNENESILGFGPKVAIVRSLMVTSLLFGISVKGAYSEAIQQSWSAHLTLTRSSKDFMLISPLLRTFKLNSGVWTDKKCRLLGGEYKPRIGTRRHYLNYLKNKSIRTPDTPPITRNLPGMIEKRVSGLCSSQPMFDRHAPPFYNSALKKSG